MSRFILGVLPGKATEPVTTQHILVQLMDKRKQFTEDRRLVKVTMKHVGMAFIRQKAAGTVRAIQGLGPVTLWEMAR